ncbi:hypothetical protein BJY52DRAFT_1319883 [Lactarius psammicola]|nr:hypothetical protein BJY52DRAFT_1319883 [Lactarius psammicola]
MIRIQRPYLVTTNHWQLAGYYLLASHLAFFSVVRAASLWYNSLFHWPTSYRGAVVRGFCQRTQKPWHDAFIIRLGGRLSSRHFAMFQLMITFCTTPSRLFSSRSREPRGRPLVSGCMRARRVGGSLAFSSSAGCGPSSLCLFRDWASSLVSLYLLL